MCQKKSPLWGSFAVLLNGGEGLLFGDEFDGHGGGDAPWVLHPWDLTTCVQSWEDGDDQFPSDQFFERSTNGHAGGGTQLVDDVQGLFRPLLTRHPGAGGFMDGITLRSACEVLGRIKSGLRKFVEAHVTKPVVT